MKKKAQKKTKKILKGMHKMPNGKMMKDSEMGRRETHSKDRY